jgi:hypothetical protein
MTFRNVFKILSLSAVSVTLLAGCQNGVNPFTGKPWSGDDKPRAATAGPACPDVGVMPELARLTIRQQNKPVAQADFVSVKPSCRVEGKAATVRMDMAFKGALTPSAQKDAAQSNFSLPYFVSVVSPQGEIISKDVFTITMTLTPGETSRDFSDLLEQTIPLAAGTDIGQYRIVVGFLLSEDDLAYNRSQAGMK